MTTIIIGKTCHCPHCNWTGSYSEVSSMAGYEFCPSCKHSFLGFMPEAKTTEPIHLLARAERETEHVLTRDEWKSLSEHSRENMRLYAKTFVGLFERLKEADTRLATLAQLWTDAPVGLREFAGKHGESRKAWLEQFEGLLNQ